MVLADPVGKPRPFWRGFLLTVLTFGFYTVYWDVRAHRELYDQFELSRERRDDGLPWYAISAPVPLFSLFVPIFPILRFVYYGILTGNLRYLRTRFGHRGGAPPGLIVGLMVGGLSLFYLLVLLGALLTGVGGGSRGAVAVALGLMGSGLVLYLGARIAAYYLLQTQINEVWEGYARRMAQLRTPPTPTGPGWRPLPGGGPPGPASAAEGG